MGAELKRSEKNSVLSREIKYLHIFFCESGRSWYHCEGILFYFFLDTQAIMKLNECASQNIKLKGPFRYLQNKILTNLNRIEYNSVILKFCNIFAVWRF